MSTRNSGAALRAAETVRYARIVAGETAELQGMEAHGVRQIGSASKRDKLVLPTATEMMMVDLIAHLTRMSA